MMFSLIWFYLAGIALVTQVAWEKGRNGYAWFAASLLASPVLCLLALIALPSKKLEAQRQP